MWVYSPPSHQTQNPAALPRVVLVQSGHLRKKTRRNAEAPSLSQAKGNLQLPLGGGALCSRPSCWRLWAQLRAAGALGRVVTPGGGRRMEPPPPPPRGRSPGEGCRPGGRSEGAGGGVRSPVGRGSGRRILGYKGHQVRGGSLSCSGKRSLWEAAGLNAGGRCERVPRACKWERPDPAPVSPSRRGDPALWKRFSPGWRDRPA